MMANEFDEEFSTQLRQAIDQALSNGDAAPILHQNNTGLAELKGEIFDAYPEWAP